MAELKLFVWQDVLWDYSPGMIVALAPDLETAIAICREQEGESYATEMAKPYTMIDIGGGEIPPPRVWAVHGGS